MLFSSITFLYYFLPITLLLYYVMPEKYKNLILLIASFFFYFWGEPKYCILMAISICVGYIGGRWIQVSQKSTRKAKVITAFHVAAILAFLVIFKYADFFLDTISGVTGAEIPLLKLTLPIGISFYTFQIISYFLDVYRGNVIAEQNFINFATYVTMFPQLIAGPIVRFQVIQQELRSRKLSVAMISAGINRFVCGLAKKVLIADVLGELVIQLDEAAEKNIGTYWVIAIAYALQIYYDFSGYSDMAIGLGKMLGFTFPENFNYPYIAKSITEFWRRWHMTLGSWFRDYVYIPLGGNRVRSARWIGNVFVVWFLSGLWHGASWNFVLWGLYFGFLLMIEKLVKSFLERKHGKTIIQQKSAGNTVRTAVSRSIETINGFLGHVYTIVLVVISFVIFRLEDMSQVGIYLLGMFGIGTAENVDPMAIYQIRSYGWMLTAAVLGATPVLKYAIKKLETCRNGKKVKGIVTPIVNIALLLLVTAFLIQSSVHPFLYFRF